MYNNSNGFYDLTDEEQKAIERFDKYIFEWGENFDDWTFQVVVKDDVSKFFWVYTPKRNDDTYDVRNNINCFDVHKVEVQLAYSKICELIPEQYWPVMIKRF